MDKANNKTNKNATSKATEKGMNRTEFAEEYSVDTGRKTSTTGANGKTGSTSKNGKTEKTN